ncbi:BrnA antitoxin family protein [Accumulibacter sp.]|uniref:BrnA antitoxin family protein n=1 Tax=Accumulibacter sp. TaxID=2053492 RepID=UPI0025E5D196|nr:BrnA antitoxin family protein [Accumulibacter sp.]MCP5229260.1 BrnA antitoxin family protein [Accumulibacter sp.]
MKDERRVKSKTSTLVKERKRVARVAKAALVNDPDSARERGDAVALAALRGTETVRKPGRRGPQKLPTKVAVTVRYSPQVLEYFKGSGDGWQTRMNDVLRAHVEEQQSQHQQDRAA